MQKSCLFKFTSITGLFLFLSLGMVQAQNVGSDTNTQKVDNAASEKIAIMSKRMRQLETQIVDMQVAIGALETFIRQNRNGENNPFKTQTSIQNGQSGQSSSSGDTDRLDILETQMRALSSQIEQLTLQMGNNSYQKRADNNVPERNTSQGNQFGFGASNEGQGQQKSVQNYQRNNIKRNNIAALPKQQNETGQGRTGVNPVVLYDKAKGFLWRRDFAAAEGAFKDFLKLHSGDALAGDAQFWLGVTYFERKNYRKAADNFLKVYKKYRNGKRAPDSLLRLALSLDKLGERQAACATFVQLRQKYPNASESIQNETVSQMKTLRCKS